MLNRIFFSAGTWAGLGLLSGLYWREFTKLNDFTGATQLSTAHTHALALGMLMLLAVLALAKTFNLPEKGMNLFILLYNIGVGLTFVMMLVKGSMQVLAMPFAESPMLSGFHGLGHMIVAGTLVHFFLMLMKAVRLESAKTPDTVSV